MWSRLKWIGQIPDPMNCQYRYDQDITEGIEPYQSAALRKAAADLQLALACLAFCPNIQVFSVHIAIKTDLDNEEVPHDLLPQLSPVDMIELPFRQGIKTLTIRLPAVHHEDLDRLFTAFAFRPKHLQRLCICNLHIETSPVPHRIAQNRPAHLTDFCWTIDHVNDSLQHFNKGLDLLLNWSKVS